MNSEINNLKKKGSQCSVNGSKYEKQIYNILKNTHINNKPFNTQQENELGGSSSKNDIECNFNKDRDIGIEVKIFKTPDWMQCSMKKETNQWEASKKGKIPVESRLLFNDLVKDVVLYNGDVPPFMKNQITYEEWVEIKKNTDKWNDIYIDIPSDSISRCYRAKGCEYIQISDYGLYHLGEDTCNFDVPEFKPKQQLRIRIKIHTKKNKKGFCSLSVTAACQPKDINQLQKSKYSLDDRDRLPVSLVYMS